MFVFDFETEAIEGNTSVFPPKPVGMAYVRKWEYSEYIHWGHPGEENPQAFFRARQLLGDAIDKGEELLCHHGKFDTAVMMKHMDLPFPKDPTKLHDTVFQIFLKDPYADTFSLKPSAERILEIKPEEQDNLRDWILAHVPQATLKNWGAHISKAPSSIVGPYACGDVDRTLALYEHLKEETPVEAYQREQRLVPIVMEGERHGVRVDVDRLGTDVGMYEGALLRADQEIYKVLGEVDLGKGEQLADALERAGLVEEFISTPTGRRSTSRDNLIAVCKDPELTKLLVYRGALSHSLSNFGRPWLQLVAASPSGERLHPDWNQVRQDRAEAGTTKGTKTGRISCTKPNFTNVSNEYDLVIPAGFPGLPIMRQYLLPERGHRWLKRDYSQQEFRILAHYTEGRLYERYKINPRIDAHAEGKSLIQEHAGLDLPRKYVKITGFSILYGSGVPSLSTQLGVPIGEAYAVKKGYLTAFPEIEEFTELCKSVGYANQPIYTWGGRAYYTEPPKIVKGVRRTFEYKLLNYLIQGSAADCTKEALIRYDQNKGNGEWLCQVYDEVNVSAPEESWRDDMSKLRDAMESIEFDVKMLSDGGVGPNWATLEETE